MDQRAKFRGILYLRDDLVDAIVGSALGLTGALLICKGEGHNNSSSRYSPSILRCLAIDRKCIVVANPLSLEVDQFDDDDRYCLIPVNTLAGAETLQSEGQRCALSESQAPSSRQ